MKAKQITTTTVLLTFGALISLTSSCGPGQFLGPTLTPTLTATLTPTVTLTSTATPRPTSTSTLTSTPLPTNTPIGMDVPLVTRVLSHETFEDGMSSAFEVEGNSTLANGILILDDPVVSGSSSADGYASIRSTFDVKERTGYLTLFRTSPKSVFSIGASFDGLVPWFAITERNGTFFLRWSGEGSGYKDALKLQHQPETWYYFLFWLNSHDIIEGRIWEKDHSEVNTSFMLIIGEEYLPIRQLEYSADVAGGRIEIDEFQELEFSD